LKGVLDAVRTEILKWGLKLEKDGILGEGMTFSKDEQQKASEIHYTTHIHGNVGNVAQNSEHVNQIAHMGIQPKDLARLVTDFGAHIDELNLDTRQKQRAEAQLEILKTELSGEPDPGIVKQAGRALWNITQGAISNVLAAAATQPSAWHWIQQILTGFSQ
jgi:AbiTii-like protein